MPAHIAGGDAATPTIIEGTAEAVTTHNADTTAVHGITNTASLVVTTDARLTDARTPTAHATTHKSGGSDAIRLDELAAPTASVALNTQKITGLLAGVASTDAATVGQLSAAGVPASTFDADTILKADTNDTPVALPVGASTVVGRKATGSIAALTGAEVAALLSGVAPSAVTGTAAILGANTFTGAQTIGSGAAVPLTGSTSQARLLAVGNPALASGAYNYLLFGGDVDTANVGVLSYFHNATDSLRRVGLNVGGDNIGAGVGLFVVRGGLVGVGVGVPTAQLEAQSLTNRVTMLARLVSAQTVNAFEVRNSADALLASVSASGLGTFGAVTLAQQTAVADATDAASAITQLNALLARVRTIGLIAT